MKRLFLLAALAGVGVAVGLSPREVADTARSAVGVVAAESSEIATEKELERDLAATLNARYSLLDDPECDARVIDGAAEGGPAVSALECLVATVDSGDLHVSAELWAGRAVLLLTDRDTGRLVEIIDDPARTAWLPMTVDPATDTPPS